MSRESTAPNQKLLRYLVAMDTTVYAKRPGVVAPATRRPAAPVATPAIDNATVPEPRHATAKPGKETAAWEPLLKEMNSCRACKLHVTRHNVVAGVGNRKAAWMIVGEAPGSEEDLRGEPFVGRAGKLLDAMLKAIHLDRESVYITNTVKCRPPQNRNPEHEELQACHGFLVRQVKLVSPRILLALGKVASNTLLGNDDSLKQSRGTVHTFSDTGIPVVVTYHPAYLLRQPRQKRAAWEDLKLAVRVVADTARDQG